jgi:hypothetical protein
MGEDMSSGRLHIDLQCRQCAWAQECREAEVAGWLRRAGMLKRNPQATPEEMRELILAVAARLACPQCGHIGLAAADAPDEEALWPAARRCEVCGKPIPPERLDVFAAATMCVACQQASDQGRAPQETEYCPQCGAPLVVRPTRGQGVTRYALVCSANPPCRV